MLLVPDSQQAVVVLINANTELPFNEVNAVMSRMPIGVMKLLCLAAALHAWAWARRSSTRNSLRRP
jgi:hypothetical protein